MFRVCPENLVRWGVSFCLLLLGGAAMAQQVSVVDAETLNSLQTRMPEVVVLDVRTAEEYQAGHVPGAINIPYDQLPGGLAAFGVSPDQPVVTYCRSGRRAGVALQALAVAGFDKLGYLQGDFPGWAASGRPVVEGPCQNTVVAGAECQCGTGAC